MNLSVPRRNNSLLRYLKSMDITDIHVVLISKGQRRVLTRSRSRNYSDNIFHLQSVEELAMGDEGWCYQGPANSSNEEEGIETNATAQKDKRDSSEGAPADVAEIRSVIVRLARREDR